MSEQPQQPWPGEELARDLAAAWGEWLRTTTGAARARPGDADPMTALTAAFGGYARSVSAPMRELAEQQRELAESMERWARLQRELADQVEVWARHQRSLAETLERMLVPLTAWAPAPE